MKRISAIAVILTILIQMMSFGVFAAGDTIYVSPLGNDTTGDGSFENPYLTMAKAKSVVQGMSKDSGDINVVFMSGEYKLTDISFTAADSGSESGRVIYKSYDKDDKAVFTSAVNVSQSLFNKVTDFEILKKLPYNSREKVVCLNLSTVGINASISSDYYPQLYVDNEAQYIAKYPNSGFLYASNADGTTSFLCDDSETERSARWENAEDAWIDANAGVVYAWNKLDVVSVSDGILTLSDTVRAPHDRVGPVQYYIANLIEELDSAGEYYVDMETNMLYYYPTEEFSTAKISIDGYDADKVISLTATQYVSFEDLSFERMGKRVIYGSGINEVDIKGCNFINIQSGSGINAYAIDVEGYNIDVDSNYAYMCKDNFIRFNGGKLNGFVYGNINVTNNRIYACGFEDGQYIIRSDENSTKKSTNVGNNVSNNVISECTSFAAISVPGNDVTVHNNEIYNIGRIYNDGGAVYFGKSNLKYGNTVMYNYIHDLNENNEYAAFYSDDGYGGLTVKYNIVKGGYTPFYTGMGMNNDFSDNLFVSCVYGMRNGTRMSSTWDSVKDALYNEVKTVLESAVYADTLKAEYSDIKNMLSRTPYFAPWNTVVTGNVAVGDATAIYGKPTHQYINNTTQKCDVEGEDSVSGINDALYTGAYNLQYVDELKLYGPSDIKDINGEAEGNPDFSYSETYFSDVQKQDYTPSAALISAVGTKSEISNITMENLGITDMTKNPSFTLAPESIKVYSPVLSDSGKTSVHWERVKDASYYEVKVSENEDMSSSVTEKVFELGDLCAADFELEAGKTYYVTVSATSLGKETSATLTSDVIAFNAADYSDGNLLYSASFLKDRIDGVESGEFSYEGDSFTVVEEAYAQATALLTSGTADEKNAYADTIYDVLTETDKNLKYSPSITKAELSGNDDTVTVAGVGVKANSLVSVLVTTPQNTKESASEDKSTKSIRYMNFVSSDNNGSFSFDFPTSKLSEIEYEGEFTVYAVDADGCEVSKTYSFASFETGAVFYYDDAGNEISRESLAAYEGKAVTVKLPVINRTTTAYTPAFIITSNSGGLIKNVNYSDTQTVSAEADAVLSCNITYNSGYTYEFMLWDSFGVMKPLTRKAIIE